jgi:hypothetical protein
MKNFIAALILSTFVTTAFSQTIKYEKTFEAALAKASAQKKLIFLVISLPDKPIIVNNKKFESGLDAPDVVNKYNESFICYRVFITDTTAAKVRQRYPADGFPTYFFLDQNGSPISRERQNSSSGKRYISMADNAIKLAATGKNLSSYDYTYRAGGVDAPFLKEYITKRQSLGFDDNAQLIDEYVNLLSVKALDNYQEVLFIFKAGPMVKLFVWSNT